MRLFTLTTTSLIASISTFFGEEQKCPCPVKPLPPCEQIPDISAYNTPVRLQICKPCDIFTTGSFIYWQPIQENMELGIVTDSTNTLDLVNGHVVNLDFEYKPGFKLGIGMNFDYDNWDTYLQYTWFQGSHRTQTTLNPANTSVTIIPAWQIPDFLNPHYATGSEKWKLTINLLDWDLARTYFVGTKLTFRPFFGARAAWIFQTVHADYINHNAGFLLFWPNTHISQNSHSWGVGPRAGICTNWKVGSGCRIYGSGEVDVLFTQYTHLKMRQTSEVLSANRYTIRQKDANYLRTHLDLTLGFGWGTYILSNRQYIDLSADYGYQVFFDQNMFRNFVSAETVGKGISPNGNLYIHGLTATVRLDF